MPKWDDVFQERENRWDFIHEQVMEFSSQMRDRPCQRILDLGCGAGRHTLYLASMGFEVSAMDLSETALEYTRRRMDEAGFSADLQKADMEILPYPSETFEGIISIHVIFHNTLAGMQRTIDEMWRILRPGGRVLITFLSRRGYRFGRGEKIEENTFIPDIGLDAGVPHHFSSLAEIEFSMNRFVIKNVHLNESIDKDDLHRSSHWEVLAEKPLTN